MLATRMRMGGPAPKVLAFETSVGSSANASTYTFTAVDVGPAAADRRNIIAAHAQNGTAGITNVTVGGDAWTEIQDAFNVSCVMGLGIVLNPVGTAEDIVVTFAASHTSASIGVWSSTGLNTDTPVDSGFSTATAPTDTLTTVAGGFAIGAITNQLGGPVSWAGVTERYDALVDTHVQSAGDAVTDGTNLTITATITGASRQVGVFASF